MRDIIYNNGNSETKEWSLDLVERFLTSVASAMIACIQILLKVARSDASILIQADSGAGKELAAWTIHAKSLRVDMPFIAVNCAAIPESLFEVLLFGAEAGSYTGAVKKILGFFELADGGTLFLDEVGELSRHLQAKLLRVLETGKVWRLGGHEAIATNVRVVAATNRDLGQMTKDGQFREDLYYRLAVVVVRVPSLCERLEDLPRLVQELTTAKVTAGAMAILRAHAWPGNVRELKNVLERAGLLALVPGVIDAGDITFDPYHRPTPPSPWPPDLGQAFTIGALPEVAYNQDEVARRLGWSASTLSRLLSDYPEARSLWRERKRTTRRRKQPSDSGEV